MPQNIKRATGCSLIVTAMLAVVFSLALPLTQPGFAPAAFAQGAIREIAVAGNRRVEPEAVRSYMRINVGEAYDPAKVNASLRALFGTGLFADVRIDRTNTGLLVTVVENPIVAQVAFEGNSEVDKDTLKAEVQLKSRSVYTRAKALSDAQRILDVYRRQGRYSATVEPKLIELDQNRVNVVFEINEGGATKVSSINFIGNRAFSDSQLRDIVTTTQSGWFDFLKSTNVYDPDRLNLDRELVRQYYLKNGYADVRVITANAELDREGQGFFITLVIDEGERYSFGNVVIDSKLPEITPEALRGELLTFSGSVFNAQQIEKSVEALTLRASGLGVPFARVAPRVDRDVANRLINLTYEVTEGPRVYIERIDISGNVRTKDYVIRREFRLAEGDAYNPLMVDQAKKRLEGLGFFKSVKVERAPGSSNDRVNLMVLIEEQPTGELSFGAGYSSQEGVIGDISITERNLFGNGQFVRLKVGGSIERFQIDLSFTEPRFLDRNIAAGFDLFHKELDQIDSSGYKSRKSGGALRLGFPIAENIWINTSYMLSLDNIYQTSIYASRAVKEAEGDALTSALGTSITYDGRNHPRDPNRGVYFQLGSDFAGVGGDVKYVRVQGEIRGYYPIYEKITLVGRLTAGHIAGWGGEDVRLLDMFYRGGETVRGFAKSGYGPRDLNTNSALGGDTHWAANVEVRFPLPLIPEEFGMTGAIFADAGSNFGAAALAKNLNNCANRAQTAGPGIFDAVCLADDSSVRASVGAGLLWNSPLGPIRLDYAIPILKESYDDIQRIRFGASTKF